MPEPQPQGEGWTTERAAVLLKAGLIAGIGLALALVWRPWEKKETAAGPEEPESGPDDYSAWEPEP